MTEATTFAEETLPPVPDAGSPPELAVEEYRALSGAALGSMIVGGVAPVMFLTTESLGATLFLGVLPLLGVVLGLIALATIRRRPRDLTGRGMASAGLVLSTVCLVGGVGLAIHTYLTEVPDGYTRMTWTDFRPEDPDRERLRDFAPVVGKVVKEGDNIFLKGYIRGDSSPFRENIREFLLVRDSKECCFGPIGDVKYYDQLWVQLQHPLKIDYDRRVFKLGGKLEPPNTRERAEKGVLTFKADYVK